LKILIRYIAIVIFILFGYSAHSQDLEFVFEHYGVEDGLSQSETNCIFQDSKGFIWIGTQAGLNRFDGREFISYDHNPLDSNSISSGWVYAIAEDSKGNLWLGTKNGLNKFNPTTEKFEHFLTSKKDINDLLNNTVYAVLVDKKDAIWLKTDYTISKYLPSEDRFIHYSNNEDDEFYIKANDEFSLPLLKTKTGVWAGSSFGLQFFSFDHDQIQNVHNVKNDYNHLLSKHITALALDYNGHLYVGTEDGIAYLLPYYKTLRTNITDHINHILDSLGSKIVTSILILDQTNKRTLIISSYGGLIAYNLINKKYKVITEDKNNPKALKYNRVKTLLLDKSGNFWVGLSGKGINKYSPKAIKFKTYQNSGNSGINLSDNMIASIYAENNKIWVGTWAKGLNIIDVSSNKVEVINTKGPKNRRINDNHVHCIHHRENGNIWIGTKNGINIYSKSSNNFYSFEKYFGIKLPHVLSKTRINIISENEKTNEIAIGSNKGVAFFNLFTKTFSLPKASKNIDNINASIYDIFIDDENTYWIASFDGLFKINSLHQLVKVYKAGEELVKNTDGTYKTLNSSSIFDITKDKYGYFWLATESGLNKFNPIDESFSYYTKENKGLPNNTVYEILLAKDDKLWFSTNRGIASLNILSDSIKTYTNSDGLQGLEFNIGASYADNKGQFFFGGADGFNVFIPDSIRENSTKPKTILLKYSIIDNKGKKTISSLFSKNEIKMSYSDNSIKIYFASLEFTNPAKNQFKYILEGQNKNWFALENQNYVTFHSLKPGEYTLRVKSSNNDLVWGNEAVLKITVSPPLYDNTWAYLVYILVAALIIYKIWHDNKLKQKRSDEEIRNKQLMNLKLEHQKEELDIQNTSMTDSINYAKHIQEAMLPSEYLFKKLLPNSFVLYMTKDIVSGDFYWITQKTVKTFIAAVDCTGHGVPGAFMSIIGFDLLKNIVKERGVEDPAEILNQLNYGVSDTFRKNNTDEHKVKDGMDMALCVIDHSKHTIEFSGAMNPLCLIRDGAISIIKGNRFSIGSFNDEETNKFEKHIFKYKTGDIIYLFSDGYPDQFGGPLGKKFKHKRFFHMLLNISHLPIDQQYKELKENFLNWKGQVEQVDDVLVIGFKL